jgi:hypothetical protein
MFDRLTRSQWLVIAAAVAVVIASWHPSLQSMATRVVDSSLKSAVITFASLRALNGFISVVQGTEVSAGPILGQVTIAIGQGLDPINDLIEQVSTVMLWATVSLGIQKAVLVLCGNWVVSALITLTAIGWAAAFVMGKSYTALNRVMLIMFLVRFLFPVMAVGSHAVFDTFFANDLTDAQREVATAAGDAGKQSSGVLSSLMNPKETVEQATRIARNLPETIVRVTVSFLIQTIVLPLFMLWALLYVGRGFFRSPSASSR